MLSLSVSCGSLGIPLCLRPLVTRGSHILTQATADFLIKILLHGILQQNIFNRMGGSLCLPMHCDEKTVEGSERGQFSVVTCSSNLYISGDDEDEEWVVRKRSAALV